MNRVISLTEGRVWKVLLQFSVPFFLANLLQALYGAVDLMVVGKYCTADSVAAVSTGTQVTQIIISLITGLTLAGTIMVGKYKGMNREQEVEKTISSTLLFFAFFSVCLTIVMFLCVDGILGLLQVPEASSEEAYRYVFICCFGIFFTCEYNALSAVLRGYGDSVTPLLCVAAACVCNIAGDFLTVGVLEMGAAGTAVATVVSQGVSMTAALFWVSRKQSVIRISVSGLRMDRKILKEMILLGIPVSFQECMVRFSFLYLTAIINGFGVYAASAVGIAGKYDTFAMLPAVSVGSALAALTAQNLGAGRKDRAKAFTRTGILWALFCSALFFCWAQISPQSMMGIFTSDSQVIHAGIPFFRACSFDYLAVSVMFGMNGYLNGSEKTVFTMLNCCGGALLIRVPFLAVLSGSKVESLMAYGIVSPLSSMIMIGVIFLYLTAERKKSAGILSYESGKPEISGRFPSRTGRNLVGKPASGER